MLDERPSKFSYRSEINKIRFKQKKIFEIKTLTAKLEQNEIKRNKSVGPDKLDPVPGENCSYPSPPDTTITCPSFSLELVMKRT